jgi:hypothetical protein
VGVAESVGEVERRPARLVDGVLVPAAAVLSQRRGRRLVTGERERPSVPRSGNAVPGTGTRERFRSYSVKLHPKCRSSFLDPSFPFRRSGDNGD